MNTLPYYDVPVGPELAILLADVVSNLITKHQYQIDTLPDLGTASASLVIDTSGVFTYHLLFCENTMIRRRDGSKTIRVFSHSGMRKEKDIVDWLVSKGFSKVRASPTIDVEAENERFVRWQW